MRRAVGLGLALGALAAAPAVAQAPGVVASIKPVHSLVASVMQGVGSPVLLVQGAASPHAYSLRPSEARAIAQADLVLWVGEGLEPFLIKPLAALPAGARVVELAEIGGVTLLPVREGGLWEPDAHDHDDAHHDEAAPAPEDAHDHEGGEDGHEHAHGAWDPHLWLDPRNGAAMTTAIAAALGEVDPAHAARYAQNAEAVRRDLERLDADLEARLAPVRERPFVVFHDAYQYFERRYDLNAVGSISVGPERRPGAQRLGEIRERLAKTEAACVFAEPQFEPAVVDTVIEGTSARKGVLDPLGADLEAGPAMYGQLLAAMAGAIADCLGAGRSG